MEVSAGVYCYCEEDGQGAGDCWEGKGDGCVARGRVAEGEGSDCGTGRGFVGVMDSRVDCGWVRGAYCVVVWCACCSCNCRVRVGSAQNGRS